MRNASRIDHLARPQYESLVATSPIILPVGSTEQHGWHLPIGTDTICVTAIAERVAAMTRSLVAPTLAYGYRSIPRSGAGEEFSGSTGLPLSTVVANVKEILAQFAEDGCKQICLLNGHVENVIPLHEASYDITREYPGMKVIALIWADVLSEQTVRDIYPPNQQYPGLALEHAAFLETSIMLHMFPELVSDGPWESQLAEFPPYDVYPTPAGFVPESGSLAPSTGANAEAGKAIIDECVVGIANIPKKEFSL